MRRWLLPVLVAFSVLIVAVEWPPAPHEQHGVKAASGWLRPSVGARVVAAQTQSFLSTFEGAPPAPLPFNPATWDVTVHSATPETWDTLDAMAADHGPDCGAPPATHVTSSYEGAVFVCNEHVMTALNAEGYGMIYLTPNQLVDFSSGEAVVRFDMSTLRRSGRDWVELWISPYDEQLQLPVCCDLPDAQGAPRRAVHVKMGFGAMGVFLVTVFDNFDGHDLTGPGVNTFTGYETFLVPSTVRRDTFELRLSRTHLTFGMPAYNFWWVDQTIPSLSWDKGVVQFGHHAYNPEKDETCPGGCQANTWHWDNVSISPAIPFTILRADRRFVDDSTAPTVSFPDAAPTNAHLRFSGIGAVEVSLDGGASWQAAQKQAQPGTNTYNFSSYWMPIPAGVSSVQFRGHTLGRNWRVQDVSIWSSTTPDPSP